MTPNTWRCQRQSILSQLMSPGCRARRNLLSHPAVLQPLHRKLQQMLAKKCDALNFEMTAACFFVREVV